jgi:hypothetical protein
LLSTRERLQKVQLATVVEKSPGSDAAFRKELGSQGAPRGAALQSGSGGAEYRESPDAPSLLKAGGAEMLVVKGVGKLAPSRKTTAESLIRSPADVFYYYSGP